MSKKIIHGFRTNMTLYSLCLVVFVAVTMPFEPLLAAAEGLVVGMGEGRVGLDGLAGGGLGFLEEGEVAL